MSSAVETSGLCAMLILPAITEVAPVRVLLSNQPQFLLSPPTLELLLSCDRGRNVTKGLNVNQCVDVVAIAEAFDKPVLVFPNFSLDIVGQLDIHRARLVGHNVYIDSRSCFRACCHYKWDCLLKPDSSTSAHLRWTSGRNDRAPFVIPPSSVLCLPSPVARLSSLVTACAACILCIR